MNLLSGSIPGEMNIPSKKRGFVYDFVPLPYVSPKYVVRASPTDGLEGKRDKNP